MTGYGIKYYFIDKKIIGTTTTTYTFEILQSGYSGSSTEWTGINIKRQYEESSFRSISTLQKSKCTGEVRVENSTQRNAIIAIATSEIGDYAVRLKRNSDIIWTGLVVPDLVSLGEENYNNQSANIVAKDILLRGDYTLSTGSNKAITIIADILDTLGYGIDIISFTNWQVNTLNGNDDVLNQVYHEKERLRIYGRTDDEDDEPISLEEALTFVLKSYGAILRQANGDWTITQITALETPSAVRRFIYNSSGTQTSAELDYQMGATLVGSGSGNFRILGNTTNNYFGGVKRIKSKFDHLSLVQGMKFNREYCFDSVGADIV